MTNLDLLDLINKAVSHGVRVEAQAGRPRLLDDETVRRANASHLSGLNLPCLGRYYGVRAAYLGQRFRELDLPVRNYTSRAARAAALAADKER
jgi:hypothetical protein